MAQDIDATLQANYAGLKEQYDLPDFDALNQAYEIRNIVQRDRFVPDFLLRYIRRRMVNILDGWTNYLHGLVMPGNQSMIMYEESNNFSEEEKAEAMKLMRRIMRISRMSVILEVEQSEQSDAQFIKDTFAAWSQLHKDLRPFVEKSRSIWEKEQ